MLRRMGFGVVAAVQRERRRRAAARTSSRWPLLRQRSTPCCNSAARRVATQHIKLQYSAPSCNSASRPRPMHCPNVALRGRSHPIYKPCDWTATTRTPRVIRPIHATTIRSLQLLLLSLLGDPWAAESSRCPSRASPASRWRWRPAQSSRSRTVRPKSSGPAADRGME
jgi:hypothetical protein